MAALVDLLGHFVEELDEGEAVASAGQVHALDEGLDQGIVAAAEGIVHLADLSQDLWQLAANLWVLASLVGPLSPHIGVSLGGGLLSADPKIDELLGLSLCEAKFFEDGGGLFDNLGVEGEAFGRGEVRVGFRDGRDWLFGFGLTGRLRGRSR